MVSYLRNKIRPAKALPWSLLGHNKGQKLEELKAGARPAERTSQKIFDLLQIEYPRDVLLQGLALLEQIGWSSTPTEQAHLPASKVMQSHTTYSSDSMQARAMAASLQPPLARSAEDRKRHALQQTLARLERRQPQNISGRHVYVKEVMQQARDMMLQERNPGTKIQNHLMKQHGKKYQSFRDATKQRYTMQAQGLAADRLEQLEEEKDAVRAQLRELRGHSNSDAKSEGSSWRMSDCKLSSQEVQELQAMCGDAKLTDTVVDTRPQYAL